VRLYHSRVTIRPQATAHQAGQRREAYYGILMQLRTKWGLRVALAVTRRPVPVP